MEKLSKEERMVLNAQRVMEAIMKGEYLSTILAPPGMDLYKYGFLKNGKEGDYQRWITKEAQRERMRRYRKQKNITINNEKGGNTEK